MSQATDTFVEQNQTRFLDELKDFLRGLCANSAHVRLLLLNGHAIRPSHRVPYYKTGGTAGVLLNVG